MLLLCRKKGDLPINELLRLACIYAESDRRGFLHAIGDGDDELAKETREFIRQIRAYRDRRWGRTAMEAEIEDNMVEKRMDDIIRDSA